MYVKDLVVESPLVIIVLPRTESEEPDNGEWFEILETFE